MNCENICKNKAVYVVERLTSVKPISMQELTEAFISGDVDTMARLVSGPDEWYWKDVYLCESCLEIEKDISDSLPESREDIRNIRKI